MLRGQVEREEGTAEDWERAVVRHVLFHPAGRLPERVARDLKEWLTHQAQKKSPRPTVLTIKEMTD